MKIDAQVERFIYLRDQKSKVAAKAKALTDQIEAEMDELQAEILQAFDAAGVESARTVNGTAAKRITRSAGVAQWDEFLPWVRQHERWDMIQRRVNSSSALEYLDDNEELPPGLNIFSKVELSITRPRRTT